MSIGSHIAPIRFGLGLRLGETPPADPEAWLLGQLARPAPPPTGVSATEAIRARSVTVAQRRERERRDSNPGTAPQQPAMESQGRGPLPDMLRDEARAWAEWRLASSQPFRDRFVDFWMNHFTVSRRSGSVGALHGPLEREAIRPHLTGRFEEMLVAVTKHPAMLVYLDNHTSIGPNSPLGQRARRGLNENLAREVLELHSLSPAGGYTQADVQEFAKLLTGWSVAMDREPFGPIWRANAHEPGTRTLMGRRFPEGQAGLDEALRFLGTHPATYRHLAAKLSRHFVSDDPPRAVVSAVEQALTRTNGDLGAAAEALIRAPQAWDPPLAKFRTPADYAIAAARALGLAEERADVILTGMATLAQPLWTAPQPNGWPDSQAEWASPEALMRRVDWAYNLAGRAPRADARAVAEAALGLLGRAETATAMGRAGSVRDSLTLLFGSPEFMHR